VDSGVIGGLKHDARMRSVHLVDAHGPVGAASALLLLSHPFGHEEGVIIFVLPKPKKVRN